MIAGDQGMFSASLLVDDRRFLVHHTDFVALGYYFAGASNKPFLSALVGPSGRNMVDAQPPDHAHHRGIWWGHGDVNGVDFYLEVPKPEEPAHRLGAIEHLAFDELVDDAPHFGFTERLAWRGPDGVLIEETRRLLAHFEADDRYTIDLDSTYTATADLTLGDTKESVLPGIRLAEKLTTNGGGTMVGSHGGVAEAENMGQRAAWVDCSVHRSGLWWKEVTEGIAIFDHPENHDHPNVWFCRDYGPVSPREGNHFLGAGTMAAGESLRLRHRILVHTGDAGEAGVAAEFDRYAGSVPPTAQ